ncbi:hypothetical protein CC1G_12447 [Coprinopsis cinerea okayama7|uniref:F-box domain-containing protein n=1 Tax=Coprinopsis cinerea (strain Okayama-7 / 130 / ATCC MYA-4618 / FGSC 9003) TaxID=240176 RepID=A8NSU5_COPC7|nr:hypothetical protein CC1G_12447 [Coprinopsis cinerea okayama7\|eukprot:XP_001836095.1 hypothetical protein CC1G_12447 [Coprinopsis cinerea okayama7\
MPPSALRLQPAIYQLPNEILTEIAAYVNQISLDEDPSNAKKATLTKFDFWVPEASRKAVTTLENCTFVSRRFHDAFRPFLYRFVNLRTHRVRHGNGRPVSILRLLKNLRALLDREPRIARWIRVLGFWVDFDFELMARRAGSHSDFGAILSKTTSLTSFRIDGYALLSWQDLRPGVQAALEGVCRLRTLRELRVVTRLLPPAVFLSAPSLCRLELVDARAVEGHARPGIQGQIISWSGMALKELKSPLGLRSLSCHQDLELLQFFRDVSPWAFGRLERLVLECKHPQSETSFIQDFLQVVEGSLEELDIRFGDMFGWAPLEDPTPQSLPSLDFARLVKLRRAKLSYGCKAGVDDQVYEDMLIDTLASLRSIDTVEEVELYLPWRRDYVSSPDADDPSDIEYARLPAFLRRLDGVWSGFRDGGGYRSLKSIKICIELCGQDYGEREGSMELIAPEDLVDLPSVEDLFPTLHSFEQFRYETLQSFY